MITPAPTNNFNLPGPIVRAVMNDPYNSGHADISTTRLINPPQIETLRYRHRAEIVEDVSERIWTMLGQAVHVIAERSAGKDVIAEQRYFGQMEGWTVSGAVDLIEGSSLLDYKVTSVWTYIYKSRIEEWTAQGNVNRWLIYQQEKHPEITKLENILILRDWAKRDAAKKVDYPQVQIVTQPLELWPLEKAEAYVRERVLIHQKARSSKDEELQNCTNEERWENKGRYIRCEEYCSAAPFCHQFKNDPKPSDAVAESRPVRVSSIKRKQDTAG